MWLRLIPWGVAAIGVAAAGFLFWRLGQAHERIGQLESERDALKATVEAKDKATRGRAQTEQRVRQMAPEDKLRGLK